VFEIMRELVPEIEADIEKMLGARRAAALRSDLELLAGTATVR
jgi:hypothetical protein